MTMLGLGAYPAADVTAFQMFQDHGRARSVSPWTQQTAAGVECFAADFQQVPVGTSSRRLPPDQFTPQEYPIATKLPPRQLQWVTSHTHGYDVLSYDVETIQPTLHHHGQLQPVSAAAASNSVWSSSPFNQPVPQNPVAAAVQSPASDQPFHDPATKKNYFAACSLNREGGDATTCGRVPFVVSSVASFTASSSYAVPSTNSFDGGVKSDPDGPVDWQRSSLPPVWHRPDCSATSPGQPTAGGSTSCSSRTYASTMPYTPVQVQWSAVREQKPMRITPSMSIGKQKTLVCYMMIIPRTVQ